MCVFGKHTFPEIEFEGVSKRNIVFLGHTNFLLEESICVHEVCVWMSGQWSFSEEGLMVGSISV